MENSYVVINPHTDKVIGYISTNEPIESLENTFNAFSFKLADFVLNIGRSKGFEVKLGDQTHPLYNKEDLEKYRSSDLNLETYFSVIVDDEPCFVESDHSEPEKLKAQIPELPISEKDQQLLVELATTTESFVLKSFKEKTFEKVKVGDVLIVEKTLVHVVSKNEEQELTVKKINSCSSESEPYVVHAASFFRVGHY